MKITLTMDLQPHEDGIIETEAIKWRCEALHGLCEDYGVESPLIHTDGLGVDVRPEMPIFQHAAHFQLSLGGLALELMELEKDFLSGRPYRQIAKELNQSSCLEW